MNKRTAVELDDKGKPIISRFDEDIEIFLGFMLATAFYFCILNAAFRYTAVLLHSPILVICYLVFRVLIKIVSWIIAFVLGLIFGNVDFSFDVYEVCVSEEMSMAVMLIVLLLPVIRISVKAVSTIPTHKLKKQIFFFISLVAGINFLSVVFFIFSAKLKHIYILALIIYGFFYMTSLLSVILGENIDEKNQQRTTEKQGIRYFTEP